MQQIASPTNRDSVLKRKHFLRNEFLIVSPVSRDSSLIRLPQLSDDMPQIDQPTRRVGTIGITRVRRFPFSISIFVALGYLWMPIPSRAQSETPIGPELPELS